MPHYVLKRNKKTCIVRIFFKTTKQHNLYADIMVLNFGNDFIHIQQAKQHVLNKIVTFAVCLIFKGILCI